MKTKCSTEEGLFEDRKDFCMIIIPMIIENLNEMLEEDEAQ